MCVGGRGVCYREAYNVCVDHLWQQWQEANRHPKNSGAYTCRCSKWNGTAPPFYLNSVCVHVVLDSVDCHNSVITTKSTNDSKELCQEGNLCIGQNPDVSKCDDGEPEFLLKDDDKDKHDETSGVNFEW